MGARRLRILFFSLSYPTPWQPTAAVFNRTMLETLTREHEIHVVAPVPWTKRLRFTLPAGAPGSVPRTSRIETSHPMYLYPPGLLREHYGTFLWASCRKTLRRAAAHFEPDVLLAYWTHPDGEVMLRAARELARPGVVIVGGSDVLILTDHPRRRRAIERVLQTADEVLSVGQGLRRRVVELGAPVERVTAFHRGVDTILFHPGDRSAARARLGLPAAARAVLWVGRMVPVKGLETLLDAWARLRAGADSRLYLVGDGPMQAGLEARAARLALGGRVVFVGAMAQSGLADWYRSADLTVLPSLSEGIPNVLLESLACGTPFVASDVGGVREIGADPERDLVPAGDSTALAALLERRLLDPGTAVLPSGFSLGESADVLTRVLASAVARRTTC